MKSFQYSFGLVLFLLIFIGTESVAQLTQDFDIVLIGGRVIDPETGLDAIKNVGIIGNRIAEITSHPLNAKEIINAKGLVVAPGFIDMHVHGRTNVEQEYRLRDGTTTALELESGIELLGLWYKSRESKSLINYGASVSWPFERFKAQAKYAKTFQRLYQLRLNGELTRDTVFAAIAPSYLNQLTSEEINMTLENVEKSLSEGGIGIGVPIGYLPEASAEEVFRIYQLAGVLQAPIFTHVRSGGIMAIQQTISDAVLTNAPLQVVHINSMAGRDVLLAIEMVNTARKLGYDISAEIYPYTAGSTRINSAIFDEGWQERMGLDYKDLQWVPTGERLTKESFDLHRTESEYVIIHAMKEEWIRAGIIAPGVMIASDGSPYYPNAHPRGAGTFAKVLGRYVREEKLLSLSSAIEKMTLLPAKRLESISPMMRFKGRIQIGADADITIFNPETIIDKATFEKGLAFSEGVEYIIVNGTIVLKHGRVVENTFPGQGVYGKYKK